MRNYIDIFYMLMYNRLNNPEEDWNHMKKITEKFDIIITRKQHSVDREKLYINGKIIKTKSDSISS